MVAQRLGGCGDHVRLTAGAAVMRGLSMAAVRGHRPERWVIRRREATTGKAGAMQRRGKKGGGVTVD